MVNKIKYNIKSFCLNNVSLSFNVKLKELSGNHKTRFISRPQNDRRRIQNGADETINGNHLRF